jgi:hypothetical protein
LRQRQEIQALLRRFMSAAGAYMTTSSSVGFNGYPPRQQYVI